MNNYSYIKDYPEIIYSGGWLKRSGADKIKKERILIFMIDIRILSGDGGRVYD